MAIWRYHHEKPVAHKHNCLEVELAVSRFFDIRQNIVLPNWTGGTGYHHECDLVVVTQSNYAYEVEIKVSTSDLKADAHKTHAHRSRRIKLLYFAVPEHMEKDQEHIPAHAGVMIIRRRTTDDHGGFEDRCEVVRAPHVNREAVKWTAEQKVELMRLSTMRIWSLKEKLWKNLNKRG